MNMRNLVLILIAVMIVSFAIAVATGGSSFSWNTGLKLNLEEVDQTYEFDAAQIEDLQIETISSDVNIVAQERTDVKVHLYGEVTEDTLVNEIARMKGNKLLVEVKPKSSFGINLNTRFNVTLDVYVPADYANNLLVDTVSGRLDIADLSLNRLEFNSVSGDMRARPVQAQNLYVDTVSGSVKADGFAGDIKGSSVSGRLEVEYNQFANDITFNTTSGDVELTLPEDARFAVSLETVSGKVNSDFPISVTSTSGRNFSGVVGDDQHQIKVDSVSGGINIFKK